MLIFTSKLPVAASTPLIRALLTCSRFIRAQTGSAWQQPFCLRSFTELAGKQTGGVLLQMILQPMVAPLRPRRGQLHHSHVVLMQPSNVPMAVSCPKLSHPRTLAFALTRWRSIREAESVECRHYGSILIVVSIS